MSDHEHVQVQAAEEPPTLMGILAERVRMTEGQLYTAVLAVLLVVWLTLAGVPHAHKLPPANGGSTTTSGTTVAP